MRVALLLLLAATPAAAQDWGGPEAVWRLTEMSGTQAPAGVELRFPEPGRISGKAPCNSFSGPLEGAYPAFQAGALAATRMACPDLEVEARFFELLSAMTAGLVEGDAMILTDGSGRHLVFQRD